jgi:apolipoprotein D and lipocalin family protein
MFTNKYMSYMKKLLLFLSIPLFSGCVSKKELAVVPNVDIQRYQGTWYEIARLPNSFEKKVDRVSATYTPLENGNIQVYNQSYKIGSNKLDYITGVAWIPNKLEPAKLKVRFFWPFYGKYWIIALDNNYQYAMVGDPSRKYLWILSRTKVLDDTIYQQLIQEAQEKGFDTTKIIKTNQK